MRWKNAERLQWPASVSLRDDSHDIFSGTGMLSEREAMAKNSPPSAYLHLEGARERAHFRSLGMPSQPGAVNASLNQARDGLLQGRFLLKNFR